MSVLSLRVEAHEETEAAALTLQGSGLSPSQFDVLGTSSLLWGHNSSGLEGLGVPGEAQLLGCLFLLGSLPIPVTSPPERYLFPALILRGQLMSTSLQRLPTQPASHTAPLQAIIPRLGQSRYPGVPVSGAYLRTDSVPPKVPN